MCLMHSPHLPRPMQAEHKVDVTSVDSFTDGAAVCPMHNDIFFFSPHAG